MSEETAGEKRQRERLERVDAAVDNAQTGAEGSVQERDTPKVDSVKGVSAADNPEKPGSALFRAWERKRQEGTLIAQKDK